MNRRMSNIEIIADMLKVGGNGAGKTEIMYSANMSYVQIQNVLGGSEAGSVTGRLG